MMGRQVEQGAPLYEFRLEDRVPAGHLLRKIDAILDLGFVHEVMVEHYSAIGRPSLIRCCWSACCLLATCTACARSGGCARRSI